MNDERGMQAAPVTRRQLLRYASGTSAAALAALLAACGGGGGAPPNPPTEVPKPTTGTGAGAQVGTVVTGSAVAQPTAASAQATLATGSSVAQASGTPKRGGVLIVGRTTDTTSLEPHKDASAGRAWTTQLMYSYVVQTDKNLHIQPDLAEKWDISPDGKTYTFSVRKGVTFHNGRELVATDIKYSLERILDPATAAYGRGFILSIDSIETPDPYTVKLNLKTADASLLASLASGFAGIVAKEEVEKAGGALTKSDGGSGPFMLDELQQGQAVKLKRHPNYYLKDRPYLDGITFQLIPEESSIISQLRSGNVHFAVLNDNKNYDLVKDVANLTALRSPRQGFDYVNITNQHEPFGKLEVRQAMSWALDRREVLQAAHGGYGRLTAPIPPALVDYALDGESLPQYKPDLNKAKDLLAKAGLPNGFKTELQSPAGFPQLINTAQVVAGDLKKIGIDVELKQIEYGTWIKGFQNHEFIMTTNLTSGNADPDAVLYPRLSSKGANNNSWNDAEVDDLLVQGKTALDPQKRVEIYKKAQQVLIDKAPQLWTVSSDLIEVMKKNVKGYVSHPSGFTNGLVSTWLES